MTHSPRPVPCHCPACQLVRVLELLRAGQTDAARLELERITRMVWLEQREPCARTGSTLWPEPPLRPPAAYKHR